MEKLFKKNTPPGVDEDLFHSVVKISLLFLGALVLLNVIFVAIIMVVK